MRFFVIVQYSSELFSVVQNCSTLISVHGRFRDVTGRYRDHYATITGPLRDHYRLYSTYTEVLLK